MRDVIGELREAAMHKESEYTQSAEGYQAFDEMAVELEVAEFLYALVRIQKPRTVVESGSGKGYSTLAIAGAIERNQKGYLWSYEPDDDFREVAQNRVADIPHVSVLSGYSKDHDTDEVDMVFLDSGPKVRLQEIAYWLYRPCSLVIHDAYRYVETLEKMGGIMFHNPRGLWVRLSDWSTKHGQIQR